MLLFTRKRALPLLSYKESQSKCVFGGESGIRTHERWCEHRYLILSQTPSATRQSLRSEILIKAPEKWGFRFDAVASWQTVYGVTSFQYGRLINGTEFQSALRANNLISFPPIRLVTFFPEFNPNASEFYRKINALLTNLSHRKNVISVGFFVGS